VPARLHAMAMRSLIAHLFKLRDEAAVVEADGLWMLLRADGVQAGA